MCNFCSVIAGGNFRHNGMTDTGAPVIVTYNFPRDADLAWDQQQADGMLIRATREAMDHVEEVAGILTVEVDEAADAMVRVSYNTELDGVSWATYPAVVPWSTRTVSDVAMSPTFSDFDQGGFGYEILLHEIGHALGLRHPFEQPNPLAPRLDNTEYTLMSYNTVGGAKSRFQELDVQALRDLYGRPGAFDGVRTSYAENADTLYVAGTRFADTLIGINERSSMRGHSGHDTLFGRDSGDRLKGDGGNDRLDGFGGNDVILGGGDNDEVRGGSGDDWLHGGWGNDTLFGGGQHDRMFGARGHDYLLGQAGSDRMDGGNHNDRMAGHAGDDTMMGGNAHDVLRGGDGDDVLRGDSGRDQLFGGAGSDTFVVTRDDYDAVMDFEVGVDVLDVSAVASSLAEARDLFVEWRGNLWLDTGAQAVNLVGLAGTAPSEIDLIV